MVRCREPFGFLIRREPLTAAHTPTSSSPSVRSRRDRLAARGGQRDAGAGEGCRLPAPGGLGLVASSSPAAPLLPPGRFFSGFLAGSAGRCRRPPIRREPGYISIFISHLHDPGPGAPRLLLRPRLTGLRAPPEATTIKRFLSS